MYNVDPIWRKYYLTRRIVLFLKQYSDTLTFKISSPLSSVVWIASSLVSPSNSFYFKIIAIGTLLAPAVWFHWRFRPFNVRAEWEQTKPASKTKERANHRDRVYVDSGDTQIKVRVLFDDSVDSYSIKFEADYPLTVVPDDRPNNSEYDSESNTVWAENVDNVRFFLLLDIESGKDKNVYDPEIRIIDTNDYNLGFISKKILHKYINNDTILLKMSIY